MRARTVITRSGTRFRGKFPSEKLDRMVHCESFHERDAVLHLDIHPQIVHFQEQPSEEIYYDEKGEAHRYYPDFLARFEDGWELLIEVKTKRDLKRLAVRTKLAAVAKRLEEQGRPFRVLTEDDLHRQPLFGNLQRIHSGCKRGTPQATRDQLAGLFGASRSLSFGYLSERLEGEARVLRLLRSGVLRADLEMPLTDESAVGMEGTEGGPNGAFRI